MSGSTRKRWLAFLVCLLVFTVAAIPAEGRALRQAAGMKKADAKKSEKTSAGDKKPNKKSRDAPAKGKLLGGDFDNDIMKGAVECSTGEKVTRLLMAEVEQVEEVEKGLGSGAAKEQKKAPNAKQKKDLKPKQKKDGKPGKLDNKTMSKGCAAPPPGGSKGRTKVNKKADKLPKKGTKAKVGKKPTKGA